MFNDDTGRRKMALAITHYAYRNTAQLENYHSGEPKPMDREFYRTIYGVVYPRLKKAQLLQRYIDDFPSGDLNSQEDFNALMDTVPEELQLRFIGYIQSIFSQFTFGKLWNAAELVEPIKAGQSAAKYVLGGAFAACCESGALLNDATMRLINQDVHNRIYTLLISGYFNK
ncbi:MAG: hypothetical protein K2L87_07145 [Clostridiales bacterium]|nr:hypothetical protein [Clostridiales bacterium]